MSRFLLSAASIFVLLITTFLLPHSVSARRCEERMPLTLMALYRTSDSIYVGRYERSEEGEPTEDTADYRVVPIKKHFSISSALKGETRKMLTIEETEYRYKTPDGAEEEESEHGDGEGVDENELKSGDSVLLFVNKNEETDAIELADVSDGVKKMTPAKLAAYEARIRELKSIFAAEKPKYSEIVDWLVRTAEDPLTRWEGTFELLQSFQNMEWQEERAKQAKEKPADAEGAGPDEYETESPKEFETGDPNFAKNLSDAQKQVLTNVLLKRERPKNDENGVEQASMINGDRELIELVKRWGDYRVAGNLLEELRQNSTDANQSADLMSSIASMLRDDELTSVSEEYSNVQWEADGDEIPVAETEQADKPADAEGAEAVRPNADKEPAQIEPEPEPESEPVLEDKPAGDASTAPARKKTYGDLRRELMGKFLARADKVIEKERNKSSAKLNR